jgi:hypothetical protein
MSTTAFSRRTFLGGFGTAMTAAAFAPRLSFARNTQNGAPIILGTGNHKYEWVRNWAQLPPGVQIGGTHGGVVVDAKGFIYFSTDGEKSIMVFTPSGKFVRAIGMEWKPYDPGQGTHDMQINKEGNQEFIYLVSLFRNKFAKITTTGEVVWVKGHPEKSGIYKNRTDFKPTGITVAPNGEFYVTDGYGANYVHRYDAKGDYVSSWGGRSTAAKEEGKFSTPHKILIDKRGAEPQVLVTDRANHRLQWFTLDGKFVKIVDGTDGDFLRLPSVLNILGTDLAIGDLAGRVTILDKDNKLVTHLGDGPDPKKRATNQIPPEQWVDGQLIAAHGLSWAANGDLYVGEWNKFGRFVKLKRVK